MGPVLKILFRLLCIIALYTGTTAVNYAKNVNDQTAVVGNEFDLLVSGLADANLKTIPPLLDQIENSSPKRAKHLFETLLAGELYYDRDSKQLLRAVRQQDNQYAISGIFTGKAIGIVEKEAIKKIKTNNKIRRQLRLKISALNLFSEKYDLRLDSVTNMMSDLDQDSLTMLKRAFLFENSAVIKNKIAQALALASLSSEDKTVQIRALYELSGSLEPAVRNKIQSMFDSAPSGQLTDEVRVVQQEAKKVLQRIETRTAYYGHLERLFFGLSLGSILLLIAAGLAITFGVMGVINLAHGELIMLGAYTTYVIQQLMPNHITASILISIPAAFLVSGFFGILIERGVIRFLRGRPLETLLATFGISLVLQQLVRTIFSPLNRQVITPEFMSGTLQINPVLSITYNRLYILFFSLFVFAVLLLILKKTSLGLHVRAVSQNRDMARALGVKSEWVDALTFALGSGVAGLAGVALSQITNVGPNLGQSYIIDSFMVVVFGGVGNLWGTLVGAFTLGSLNKFIEPQTGAVMANIIVLVGIILFIQIKPRGLFPQKGRHVS